MEPATPETKPQETGAVTIKFPRPIKRGAKVRKGPCAQIIQFPGLLTGNDLCNYWAWMSRHHREWEIDSLDGWYDNPEDWETVVRLAKEFAPEMQGRELDDHAMRGDIAEWRNIVTKRIEVKRHLRELGIEQEHSQCGAGIDGSVRAHAIGDQSSVRMTSQASRPQPAPSSTERKAGHPVGLVRSFSGARRGGCGG